MRSLPVVSRKPLFSLAMVLLAVASATAATKHVNVGAGIIFTDVSSGTSNPAVTTILVGDTVQWDWLGGGHTSTSGTCSGGNCSADGLWTTPVMGSGSFSRTFNTPGTFHYFCIPHGALMTGTIIVSNPPDFSVSISNANGGTANPIFPSQQTTFNGNILSFNGYTNTVSVSCQPGTSTLPSPCTPSPGSAVSPFPFTIKAGASSPGHYDFMAQGTDGTLTHAFSHLNFDVVDFDIAAPSPPSVTAFSKPAATSTSTSTTVNLTAAGIFSGSVALSCESNTANATCNFQPAGPYTPTASAPVSVTVSVTVPAATTAQDYNVLLDATSSTSAGSVTKKQTLVLHVVQFSASAFTPSAVTIGAGNVSNSASTHLTASTNFVNPSTVSMACTAGLPAGGACSFSPNNGVATSFPSDQAVTVSVPVNTPGGSPALTVTATGSSGGVSFAQTQSLTLNIPAPALSLGTPSPATLTMVNNSFSPPVSVQITPTNLAGAVTPSCGNLPAGVTCHFSPATVNLNGGPATLIVVFEANGATPGDLTNITINANATINGTPVSSSVGMTKLTINAPEATTDVTLSVAAINSVSNSALINVGDPNLAITATVNNIGHIYSAAVWEVTFSSPVGLVAASNPNCSQLLPVVVTCSLGDVPVASGSQYSFKVAPLFERTQVATGVITSPSVGDSNLSDNSSMSPTVQVRPRPLARRGLVPKTP